MSNYQITPTPKQADFITNTSKFSCYSGGYGCLAGESKVFNPVTGRHTRIDQLQYGHVYSKQFKGYGINWATRPKKYKKTKLYKVVTERGNTITVTMKHKFFTKDGWEPLSVLKQTLQPLLVYGGFHPLTILGIFPSILLSGVRSFWKKVQGFLWNCFSYYRLCDERLLWVRAISLVYPPSRADAVLRILLSSRRDDLWLRRERSHLYQSAYLLSKNRFSYQQDPLDEGEAIYNEQITFGQPFGTSQLPKKFLLKTSLQDKVVEFFQGLRGGFWTWYYNHTLRYEKVKSISFERTDFYYDLNVPFFNNYFAEGFVNHNSGKTYACCLKALALSSYPNNVGLIGRLSYPELRDTTRKTFFEVCPPEYYDDKQGGRWSPTENHLRLTNGSEIMFRHLDTISEAELKSMNLGWFYIDQAEEISVAVWRVLLSRLRLNRVPRRYGFISCNPEPGSWIETEFKRPYDEGRLKNDYFYIDSTTYDNPFNPPDYISSLVANYPEEMRKRFIEGRWDVMENQIYTEFDTRVHVVRPFDIPKEWEKIVGLDHGMVNPTGILKAAIDYDYNIYIYDEYYQPGVVSAHAKALHQMTDNDEISLWVIDPSTRNKTREKDGMMWSVMEEYEDYGFYFVAGNNSMLAGINRVKEWLRIRQDRINPTTHKKPSPRLFIFQNCVNLINEIKGYKWKKLRTMGNRNELEKPVDYADHLLDALRYIIMARFPPPERTVRGVSFVTEADRSSKNTMAQNSPNFSKDEEFGSLNTSLTGESESYGEDTD